MRAHLHVADTLEVHTARLGLDAAPVAVSRPFHAVDAVRGRDAGGVGRLARGEPAEERPERRVEATEDGLLGGERPPGHLPIGCPDLLQLGGLGGVANRHLRPVSRKVAWSASHHPFVGVPPLLEGCVGQLPVVVQTCLHAKVLALGGPQTERVGPSQLPRPTGARCTAGRWPLRRIRPRRRRTTSTIRPGAARAMRARLAAPARCDP